MRRSGPSVRLRSRRPWGGGAVDDGWGGFVQLDIGIEPADQGPVATVTAGDSGQGMRPITAVADGDKPAAGGPMDQDGQQLADQLVGHLAFLWP